MKLSLSQKDSLSCPKCGFQFLAEIWLVICDQDRADLCQRALKEDLHNVICPKCGFGASIDAPLLFFRPAKQPALIYVPSAETSEKEDKEYLRQMLSWLHERIKHSWQEDWINSLVVLSPDDLPRVLAGELENSTHDWMNIPRNLHALITQAQENYLRFQHGDCPSLENACNLWDEVLNHPQFSSLSVEMQRQILNEEGIAFWNLFHLNGKYESLDRSIVLLERALQMTPSDSPDRPAFLTNYGNSLRTRFQRSGLLEDLEHAIDVFQQAVLLEPSGSPDRPTVLVNLATGLHERAIRLGNPADLEMAIEALSEAANIVDLDQRPKAFVHSNLGACRMARYKLTGNLEDLDNAIVEFRQSLNLFPVGSPQTYRLLSNMGEGLRERFNRSGVLVDLIQAIERFEEAVRIIPEESPDFPALLTDLGTAYQDFYRHHHQPDAVQKAIECFETAIRRSQPGSPDRASHYINLAGAYRARYNLVGEVSDLTRAINACEKAISDTPANSPHLPGRLVTLGNCLRDLFSENGNSENLDHAMDLFAKSVAITPKESTDLPGRLNNLGTGYELRYGKSNSQHDLDKGREAYRQACLLGEKVAISETIRSSRNWIRWGLSRSAWEEVVEAYTYADRAITRLVADQTIRFDKETWLGLVQGFSSAAAFALIKQNRLEEAVTTLENGHARLLAETLALKKNGDSGVQTWVRTTLSFNEIQSLAIAKPLVFLFSTSVGGYGLIVTADNLSVIDLPGLSDQALRKVLIGEGKELDRSSYFGAYSSWRQRLENSSSDLGNWHDALEKTAAWLWQACVGAVVEKLNQGSYTQAILIPIGLSSLLPLHAAWKEDESRKIGRQYAIDSVLLTYAPSAASLNSAKENSNIPTESIFAVAIADRNLKWSDEEVATAVASFNKVKILSRGQATAQSVKESLIGHSVIHFASHGSAGFANPLLGKLSLANGTYLTLGEILELQLPQVRLVVLSACETGIPGTTLPDEIISLPAGFLQAGAAGVIGSLWVVDDATTMILMARFYQYWRKDVLPIEEALRKAQIWLRDTPLEEKKKYFQSFSSDPEEGFSSFGSKAQLSFQIPAETADRALKELMTNPNFSRPFNWAAFQYVGA